MINKRIIHQIIISNWFSAVVLLILVSLLAWIAYSVTKSYEVEPDFGGMITIRQSELDLDTSSSDHILLTRDMIYKYITDKEVLLPAAQLCGWNESYDRMVRLIGVQQKVTAKNCYTISVNTGNMARSAKMAEILTRRFIENYRRKWETQNRKNLVFCKAQIVKFEKELKNLQNIRQKLRASNQFLAVKSDLEMQAVNQQLLEAQKQYFTAYSEYVGAISQKLNEMQIELEILRSSSTKSDPKVKRMTLAITVLAKHLANFQKELERQNPDIYSLRLQSEKLVNVPPQIAFLYENIQTLQRHKLALQLPTIIREKQQMLEAEQKKRMTLEHLLNSNSCDVFIREIGR